MERRFGAFNSLATFFLGASKISNKNFPFVRIPDFAVHVGRTLQLTNAVATFFTPVVKKEVRREWENFTSRANGTVMLYINETIEYLETFKDFYGPMPDDYNWTFRDVIYTDYGEIPYNSTQPYFLPTWYIFPLIMRYYGTANFGKDENTHHIAFFS